MLRSKRARVHPSPLIPRLLRTGKMVGDANQSAILYASNGLLAARRELLALNPSTA